MTIAQTWKEDYHLFKTICSKKWETHDKDSYLDYEVNPDQDVRLDELRILFESG